MQVVGGKSKPPLQQVVRLADQLHVAVLNPVVNHLDVMSGAVFTNPVTARRTVFNLCGNRLKNVLHMRPRIGVSTGHDRWTKPGALLTSGNTGSDEQDALRS